MPKLHQLRSLLAMTRGEYELALAEAEAMAELDPNGAESHMGLGRMYFFTAQYDRAVDSFEAAQRIDPHSRGSYSLHSALAHLALGRTGLAIKTLEDIAERWPDYSPEGTRAFLAIAYELAGRHADAQRQVALLSGDDPEARMLGIERFFSALEDKEFAGRALAAAREAGVSRKPSATRGRPL
jgi:tetratricopeptide (TPR) repeat protein